MTVAAIIRDARCGSAANRTCSGTSALALGAVAPRLRQVEGCEHRVPSPGGIDQVHSELTVLNLRGRARTLPLHPDGVPALLQIFRSPVSSMTSTPLIITEMLTDELADIGTNLGVVPPHPVQQIPRSVQAGVPGALSDAPAVLLR